MFCNRHILVQIQIQKQCFVLLYQTLFWVAFVSVLEKCVTENKLISKNYSGEEREGSPEPSCHYWVQVVCQSATCTVQRKEGQIQYNNNNNRTIKDGSISPWHQEHNLIFQNRNIDGTVLLEIFDPTIGEVKFSKVKLSNLESSRYKLDKMYKHTCQTGATFSVQRIFRISIDAMS